ncbi:MAG: molybdate ABC transporter ATP-binding protein ModF [Oceanospirillaceae bacterium]|nr:molybdate ABC transporter ATP-binding protein ModF [Oceanospirillaceae bacterium]MCP5335877.1 molybdate ABC transporter ATP-binding protein ModF [Oceanospirillaceae bacterium]MCP5350351.1 molybdate ABC transporter ATP-binding protein ModF [Oceanospirillaceae bacterium]
MFSFHNIRYSPDKHFTLSIAALDMPAGQHWAFIGTNGSGKSSLGRLIAGKIDNINGDITMPTGQSCALISFEEQAALIQRERERDDSDILDIVTEGTPVIELLHEVSSDTASIQQWCERFGIVHVLQRGFRKLSTGETRKVLLIRALLQKPDILIVDEPYDGLDINSQQNLQACFDELHQQNIRIILILNRISELPAWVTHLGFLHQGQLLTQGEKNSVLQNQAVKSLLFFDNASFDLPPKDNCCAHYPVKQGDALVILREGKIAYSERTIFSGLNWQINKGEHWAILGPNGCGKTSLLNLITGDHPQCYANDLNIFGIQRGSGESIWDIKKHIGIISAALQWEYRVSCNLLSTVLSGLFDSIGLYHQVDEHQKSLAMAWLRQIHLEHKANAPLQSLSYGEQRLVLIARAMIKQPALLVLDEPCQGLDEINRQLVLAFIERLAQQGESTLLYVTHHAGDLLPCFSRRLQCTSTDPVHGSHWQSL